MTVAAEKLSTSELTGRALDWVVTTIELKRRFATGEHVKSWVAEAVRSAWPRGTTPCASERSPEQCMLLGGFSTSALAYIFFIYYSPHMISTSLKRERLIGPPGDPLPESQNKPLLVQFRPRTTSTGVRRDALRELAQYLGTTETAAVHMALALVHREVCGAAYEPVEGKVAEAVRARNLAAGFDDKAEAGMIERVVGAAAAEGVAPRSKGVAGTSRKSRSKKVEQPA